MHVEGRRQLPRFGSLLLPRGFWQTIMLRSSGLVKHLPSEPSFWPCSHFLFSSALNPVDNKIQVPIDNYLSMYYLNKYKILALFYAKDC